MLEVCPRTERVWTIGRDFGDGHQKWRYTWCGRLCLRDSTQRNVRAPHHKDQSLPHDIKNNTNNKNKQDGFGRYGGVAVGDKIYGFPNNTDEVLMVHVECTLLATRQSRRHCTPQDGRYKYLGIHTGWW